VIGCVGAGLQDCLRSSNIVGKTRPYRMREDTRSHFNRFLLKKVSAYGFKQILRDEIADRQTRWQRIINRRLAHVNPAVNPTDGIVKGSSVKTVVSARYTEDSWETALKE